MSMALKSMTHAECLEMLRGRHFGHLACTNEGQPYVGPIYFAFQSRVAYGFLHARTKSRVDTTESDGVSSGRPSKGSWRSVVLSGEFQEFLDNAWHEERLEIGSPKPDEVPPAHASPHLFYGVYMNDVSGRAAMQIG